VENPALCMGCMKTRGGARVCPHCGFDEANPPSVGFQLPLRTLLDEQYVVGRALGAGGFAITYLAWDPASGAPGGNQGIHAERPRQPFRPDQPARAA
jgi:hypothetical protein